LDPEINHIIFPSNSPVDVQGGDRVKSPKKLKPGLFEKRNLFRARKFMPLLKAREEADRVYSNGYFENHYKDADKQLKSMLHEKVMDAWANANDRSQKEKADRVYSNGYADKQLKPMLHEKVMDAWANANDYLPQKEEADRVYSNGYFENHYKDADKQLKSMFHEKVMGVSANANDYLTPQKEKVVSVEPKGGLSLNISIAVPTQKET
jgi:hypothetical protein